MGQKGDRYQELKQSILEIGVVIPGTIRKTYLICGKKNCKCAQLERFRHGPYHLWDRRVNGKLSSKVVNLEQLHDFEQWISNRRQLEKFVEELLEWGSNYATSFQDAARAKKAALRKGGK